MGGLNDWMEHRCPLHQYNCKFFVRRLHPMFGGKKSRIIFSQLNKSFGHQVDSGEDDLNANRPTNQTAVVQEDERLKPINLTDLPLELLSKIIGFLDPFSLNNLSLTNKLLRKLVSDRLEQKGLVSLIWRRVKKPDAPTAVGSWAVIGYQWKFSNLFDEIKQWRLDGDHKLLNHIANCKHFDRVIRKEPFKLIGIAKEEPFELIGIAKE